MMKLMTTMMTGHYVRLGLMVTGLVLMLSGCSSLEL